MINAEIAPLGNIDESDSHMNVAYFPLKGIKVLASASWLTALFFSASISAQTTTGNSATGADLYAAFHATNNPTGKGCVGCHSVTSGGRANAANAGAHITYANGQGMGGAALTVAQRDDIAAYIAANNTTTLATQTVSFQGSNAVAAPGFTLNTSLGDYIGLRTANNLATRGTVSYSGTTITYNASAGQCGTDTFSYEAYRSGAVVQGTGTSNERTVTFDITDPAAPAINSATAKTSTVGLATTYTITTSGGTPLSWGATSIPAGLSRTNNIISGTPTTAGTFSTTVNAFNCLNGNLAGQSDSQGVTWTVNKGTQAALTARINSLSGSQTFTFSNPNGTATLSTIGGSGSGAVTYSSSNTAVCTVTATTTLNLVGAGTCTITATKAADTNYLLTTDTIGVTVNPAAQTLSFGAQSTPRSFVQGGPFLVSPTATNTSTSISGIAITYDSNTPTVCTLPGTTSTTVTMVTAGTCTIGANLAANTNYLAATEQTQNVTINPILPQPPTIGAGVGGNAQAVVNFTPPTNTGGTTILDYTATCTASGQTTRTATVANSPATVLSMVNGAVYSCSVKSHNSVGISATASAAVNVTPTSSPVITSLNNATFTITSNGTFNIIATGVPTPTITMTGTLPTGVNFSGGLGTATLTGIPAAGTAGTTTQNYPLTFTASNGTPPAATQSFTLTVQKASQTTTFGALAGRPMRPVPTALTATASSGLPITLSIDPSTTANCSLAGNLLITNNIGACGVRASQAGNTSYYAAETILRGFNIAQGTQTIDFGAQGAQAYSPSTIFGLSPKAFSLDPIDLVTETGLAVAYASLTPGVCSSSGAFVTIVSAGICTIEVTQAGDANYAAATPVTQDIAINMASQTISWNAQSNQTFGTGGTFMISPLATGGGSGNAIIYGTSTPGVCTVTGTTVTKVSSGQCILTANQGGDGNYAAASQVSRTLTITSSMPSAPTATLITPTDSQVVVEFDPPASNGGSAITLYRVTCNPGGIFAESAASPIKVTGLNNNTEYTCSVRALNAAGNSPPSNGLLATPFLGTGSNLWANVCSGCHGAQPTGVRFNAAGTTGNVLNYVRSIQPGMLAQADVQAFTLAELAEIEKYIATFVPAIATSTAFNTSVMVDVASHLTLDTVSFTGAAVVSPPTNGSLSAFTGTQITYTPAPGFVGIDTFTYRGTRTGPTVNGDPRTVTITVNPPSIPVITSPAIAAGTFNTLFTYQITATNSPTSFGATPLGSFSINAAGLVSSTPMVPGLFAVTISATNAGGTAMQNVDITISKANQTITFGAQGVQAFLPGGSFMLSPVATTSSSLTISYSTLTPAICTVSTTTVTMVTAGVCMIAADQAGNTNYEAALQVSRAITISATVPGAPIIGTATPGDTVAAIGFTPPSNNGGSAITSYRALCNPGALTGSGDASPVTVSGLTNATLYTCAVLATNATGNSAFSSTVMVTPTATPVAPQISSANATTFTVAAPSTFMVTATGTPTPTLALVGTLPTGVSFTPGTGALAGTPALGQVGSYPLSITATGTAPVAMQAFTLTVQKADQTISFTGPVSQPITSATIPLTATASSGLTVTLVSNTTSVCTISSATLTLLTVGTCSIAASQAGNANYTVATSVTQGFTVSQASQTITFNAQVPANRGFVAGSTFAISPTASASSNLAVIYSSTTTGICSVVGTNVTMVAPGTCTIAANQSGSANFLAASQVTQNVQLAATVPGAPTIGTASGGNAQATINFTAPGNNGGSAITSYRATCNPGNVFVDGPASPIIVSGLANNQVHSCSVTAANGVGTGAASSTVAVTPLSGQGATLWTQVCDACHTTVPAGNQLNGAGISATVLDYVRMTQPAMSGISTNAQAVQALSLADLADIATYIASVITPNAVTTTVNTAAQINLNNHITLTNQAWSSFTSIEIVSGPTNGTLGAFNGTQIQYTPNANYTGTDSFTYRGKRTTPVSYVGDPQTVTISVHPPKPVITSAATANGTLAVTFGYQILATNVPTSFFADGLPGGLSVDTAGLIAGVPTEHGQFSVAISALNAGGSGDATLLLQIAQISQLITFGAQSSPRTYSVGGTFTIAPLASGGASLNAIAYGSNTPSVCTVNTTTVTMVAAGICIISADQPGNATYAAAAQVTQNVTIDPGPQTVTVTINGNGSVTGNGFACPGDCSESVAQNTVVALTAAASSGSTFSGWSGSCGGTPAGFAYSTIPVSTACSVIATFVQAANSTTTLASSLNPSNVSQSVTLTATVSGGVGTPTGTVVFRDGVNVIAACASLTLSGGVAQCTTTSLSSGTRSITAQYSGDTAYNASTSSALVQTVKGSSLESVIYLMLD